MPTGRCTRCTEQQHIELCYDHHVVCDKEKLARLRHEELISTVTTTLKDHWKRIDDITRQSTVLVDQNLGKSDGAVGEYNQFLLLTELLIQHSGRAMQYGIMSLEEKQIELTKQ